MVQNRTKKILFGEILITTQKYYNLSHTFNTNTILLKHGFANLSALSAQQVDSPDGSMTEKTYSRSPFFFGVLEHF